MTGDRGSGPLEGPTGRGMARADLWTGVVLLALALATIAGAWTMDRLEVRRIHPLSVPGLVPGLLGVALAICAVVVIAGAGRRGLGNPLAGAERGPAARLAACLALTLAYPLVLIGAMPFWLATALFVGAFVALFEWEPRPPSGHARALAIAAVMGLVAGLATAYAFQELFLVRLP